MSKPIIPPEHQMVCPTCGRIIDMRDLGQAISHGWRDPATGVARCLDQPPDVPYEASRDVGNHDSVEWTKDKKPRHLN